MTVDYIIIGQGIAGTLISHELIMQGKSVMVFDQPINQSASRVAGAVLNPAVLKGRKRDDNIVVIDTAVEVYRHFSVLIKQDIILQKEMAVFPESEEEENRYRQRANEKYFFYKDSVESEIQKAFRFLNTPVIVSPVWQINALALLEGWKNHLVSIASYQQKRFELSDARFTEKGVEYNGIHAGKIVFCEGVAARQNQFFRNYPFVSNRGDVLLLNIPGLSQEMIYHKKFRLIPFGQSVFWCGSNYKWEFSNLLPDEIWRRETEHELKNWLNLPFTIVSHTAAERPTTAGQTPFCKIHESNPFVIIFNGLGTKGFTNGPMLARLLAATIC